MHTYLVGAPGFEGTAHQGGGGPQVLDDGDVGHGALGPAVVGSGPAGEFHARFAIASVACVVARSHAAPDHESLLELGLTGLEFGYTVFTPHRRKGYAKEAAAALMGWAQEKHGIDSFVVSISPDNAPSLAVARALGFRKVASHIDPVDGLEDIFNVILDRKS